MKFDLRGIRVRLWLGYFALAVGITVFIGVLQTGLIRPYYRNSKIQSVRLVSESIRDNLMQEKTTSAGVSKALREAVDNNACIVVFNDAGKQVYSADGIGAGCAFREPVSEEIASMTKAENFPEILGASGEYSSNFIDEGTGMEMIIYGRRISAPLSNYYIFVNSPLEPVDSVVSFFSRQYGVYTLIAIIFASMAAFYVSKNISSPIVNMKKEAQKLSQADYSASFDGGSFTETQELANTLNQANEQLSRIDQMRRDLIANVSHDIRTPLTDIKAYAEMIRDISGDNPEKREKHLNVIIRETDYLDHLVNDMSELSKMQAGITVLHAENVDLCEIIYDVAEMDQSLIENAGLTLHIDLPEYLTIYADEVKISQVIANFLSNAIKHTPSGKNIYIRAWQMEDEETVRFEIRDEGEGIPEDELPLIWDRYQKSSRSFSRSQTSTGLGLAIVKGILDLHKAAYGVESKEGEGSMFWMEFRETHEG